MEPVSPVRSIPPTPTIRERLGGLIRESILTRRLLRLAEQRDKLAPIEESSTANREAARHE